MPRNFAAPVLGFGLGLARWRPGVRFTFKIPLHAQHLRRLVRDYRAYYQEDRTHDALGKDAPRIDATLVWARSLYW
jgi:hypothetical protein